jgi:valyl-tRNA synthetase
VREFIWGVFAPHYLELIKPRAYGIGFSKTEQRAAWATLHRCLRTILLLLAPITPFMTDHIWRVLYGRKSVHLQALPSAGPRSKFLSYTKPLLDFNSFVWKAKKERGISLKEGIELRIPRKLRIFASDLIAAHNIV